MRRSILSVVVLFFGVFSIFTVNPVSADTSGNTCVYVFGTVEGKTVTTPAVLITVPDNGATIDPVRVNVDPTNQEILGYSLSIPGADAETEPQTFYVSSISQEIPAYSATLNDLNIENKTCVSFGVTTPAVPIYVPESSLQTPGTVVNVPAIYLNILGEKRVVNGQVINIEGKNIIVPGVNEVVPPLTVETPDQSVIVDLNGELTGAHYLTPR
ncbi:MAG: hypothetical protein ACQEWV_32340 [Bacillota bacterium]